MPELSREEGRGSDSRPKNRRRRAKHTMLTVALLLRPAAPPNASRRRRPQRQRYSPPQRRAPCLDWSWELSTKKENECRSALNNEKEEREE